MTRNKILLIISLFLNLLLAVTIILLIVFGSPFSKNEEETTSQDTQEVLDDLILQVPDTNIDDNAELDSEQDDSAKEFNLSIYYFDIDKFNTPGNSDYVTAVTKKTSRLDMATFAIEQIISGPTVSDQEVANLEGTFGTGGFVQFVSESNCSGKDFTVSVNDGLATVKLCREVNYTSDNSAIVVRDQITKTLKQFSTVDKVLILEADGGCFDNMGGYTVDECVF